MPIQHVLILGGSSGIGLAAAERLARNGYAVTIAGRDARRLAAAKDTLGGDVAAVPLDGADFDALPAAFARVGAIDHLVLAFGSGKGLGPLAEVSLADVRAGFEEKVVAHIACAQAALPHLSGDGSLTFVSAVSGQAAMPGTAGIGAANAAVAALTPILAVELAPRRVNCVSPGVVDTPWWGFLPEDQRGAVFADYGARSPVRRVGAPDDVAQAIAFLIADSFMTGHTLICDGGLRLAS
jgi:NAD(P)-dependent dehydrogenase (short-subunit alcohol dehydrogenase family)